MMRLLIAVMLIASSAAFAADPKDAPTELIRALTMQRNAGMNSIQIYEDLVVNIQTQLTASEAKLTKAQAEVEYWKAYAGFRQP